MSTLGAYVLGVLSCAVAGAVVLRTLRDRVAAAATRIAELSSQLAVAHARLSASEAQLAERQQLLERVTEHLDVQLKAAMGDAVQAGTRQMLELSSERAARERSDSAHEQAARDAQIHQLVRPVATGLKELGAMVRELQRERASSVSALNGQIAGLASAQRQLTAGTDALVGALRRPQVRGRWGEFTLRNTIEQAGMLPHVDFVEQRTIDSPDGRLRPDVIVRLPGARSVVIDAKVPLDAFLDAQQADTDGERTEHLKRHARQLAQHLRQMASKAYWQSVPGSPQFALAFVPNDQVYLAALDADCELLRKAADQRVLIATPMTVIALLKLVANGWHQEQLARNTDEVLRAAARMSDRLAVFSKHLTKHGRQLESAVKSWNELVGSHESRLMPAVAQLTSLGNSTDTYEEAAPAAIRTLPCEPRSADAISDPPDASSRRREAA